jgi:hypothetical protein
MRSLIAAAAVAAVAAQPTYWWRYPGESLQRAGAGGGRREGKWPHAAAAGLSPAASPHRASKRPAPAAQQRPPHAIRLRRNSAERIAVCGPALPPKLCRGALTTRRPHPSPTPPDTPRVAAPRPPPAAPPTPIIPPAGMDAPNMDIKHIDGATIQELEWACGNMTQCVGFNT